MCHYPERRYYQTLKPIPSFTHFSHSTNQRKQSVSNLHNWQPILHIDRMRAKQYYDCFSEYIYNTAFGSLLSGHNCVNQTVGIGGDEPNAGIQQCAQNIFEKIPWQITDHLMFSSQNYNNSAWNDDFDLQQQQQQLLEPQYCQYNCQFNNQQQSLQDIIQFLIDFLGEFLLFLSSIIEDEQFKSQFQLQKMLNIAESIHQLRSTLIEQINNINEQIENSPVFDIASISLILHELASFIRCLSKEHQQHGTLIKHSQTTIFAHLLDRLEKIIKSCMNCSSMNGNLQTLQTSSSLMFPCMNSPCMIDNPLSSAECSFPCCSSNIYIPWSLLEQMKNLSDKDNLFGIMYGIKDETIRKKMGYDIAKHKLPNRVKRRKQEYESDNLLNEEIDFDNNLQWNTGSTDEQILALQQASDSFGIRKPKSITQKEFKEMNLTSLGNSHRLSPISPTSIMSKKKNSTNRLDSSRTISQQQTMANSKRSSQLLSSNSNIDEPITLRSIRDRLLASDGSGNVSRHVTSPHLEELPITTMPEYSESQQSHKSLKSNKDTSINDIKEKKSLSNITRNNDEQSVKRSINQKSLSYKIHVDNVDFPVMLTTNDKIQHNEDLLSKNWEQRLASPLSMTSIQRINNTSLKKNIISPDPNKSPQIYETESDFNFNDYSEHQTSRSTSSLLNQTNDNVFPLNVIEGPQSAEGSSILEKKATQKKHQLDLNAITTEQNSTLLKLFDTENAPDNNKEHVSTAHFSPKTRHRQQSSGVTSITSTNDPQLLINNKTQGNDKHLPRSITEKKSKFYRREKASVPLQSNKSYFNKFINCFRRATVNRIDPFESKNK